MPTILRDNSQEIIFQKASQMAVSTYCILWLIWLCKTKQIPKGAIYWLPSGDDVSDFVKQKVDPLFTDNPELLRALSGHASKSGWGDDTWNVGMKQIYGIETFWRGLKSKSKVKSISADADIFDEYDEAEPGQVKQAEKRTAASDIKLRRRLSVPTIPDYGINAAFKKSDQYHYGFKCSGCNQWNVLERQFPQCLMLNTDGHYYRGCKRCRRELDITKGRWISDHLSPVRGYQISQLYSPWLTPDAVMKEYHETEFMQHFYSHVLGLPYLSATDRVTFEQVISACNPARPMIAGTNTKCVAGCDQGSLLHTVIMEAKAPYKVVWAGALKNFEELDHYIRKYSVSDLVIDALPETRKARELMMRNKRKVWLCFYNDNQKGAYAWKEDERIVQVNRTESLDVGTNALLSGAISLPRRDDVMEEFAMHCEALVKTTEEDPETRSRRYVYKALRADHYRHALNYALIALSSAKTARPISVNR